MPAIIIAVFYTVPTLIVAAILGGVAAVVGLAVLIVALASKSSD